MVREKYLENELFSRSGKSQGLLWMAMEIKKGLGKSGKSQGKYIWKRNFFPGQGKVREFCGWPGKLRKDFESQGKVKEFENKWLQQAVFRKCTLI